MQITSVTASDSDESLYVPEELREIYREVSLWRSIGGRMLDYDERVIAEMPLEQFIRKFSPEAAGESGNRPKSSIITNRTESYPADELSLVRRINDAVLASSVRHGVPAGLLLSMIKAESNFNPNAVSSKQAKGLTQLMAATSSSCSVSDPWNIDENVDCGARYLAQMLDRYDGNVELALAAYNAGPGAVDKYNGVPPYRETRVYVQRVLQYYHVDADSR